MNRLLLAGAAMLACGLASAQPVAVGHGKAAAPPVKAGKGAVLYSQNGTDSGIAIVSQNFESSFDIYDSRAADDFVLAGKAKITEVDVVGMYFNGSGPALSENVTFYADKNGLPGRPIANYENVVGIGHARTRGGNATDGGSFDIPLVPPAPMPHCCRTYWVSVQVNMDFNGPPTLPPNSGEWGWENQTTTVGNPAAWENPGDGFGTGCTTYRQENVCIPDGQGDHMFTLKGKLK